MELLLRPEHILDREEITLDDGATYEDQAVKILDRRNKVLRGRTIRLVRVLWRHQNLEESTWEHEDTMQANHPHLFANQGIAFNFEDEIFVKGVGCKDV